MRFFFGFLAHLTMAAAASAATIDRTLELDRNGLNMSLAAGPGGDLHLVWRAGAGNDPASFGEIRYLHYTAADDTWHFPSLLVLQDSGSTRLRVSPNVDTNQPRIAADPTTPGRAYILFAGDFTRDIRPTLVQIDPTSDGRGSVARTLQLGTAAHELRGVDVAVAGDGNVFACNIFVDTDGASSNNGIYCHRGLSGGVSFTRERATLQQGSGEGISVLAPSGASPRVAGTFGADRNNAVHSRRDSLAAGLWSPGPGIFDIPFSAGKLRLLPPAAGRAPLYAVTSLQTEANELLFFDLQDGQPVSDPLTLHRFVHLGPALFPGQGGDRYSSEDLSATRSASGRQAVAYGIDGTVFKPGLPPSPGNDLGLVLSLPPAAAWPAAFEDGQDLDGLCLCGEAGCPGTHPPDCDSKLDGCDLFCDGLNDLVGGTRSLDQVRDDGGPFPYVGQGAVGREAIAFDGAETLSIAFSGESLWVAYHDGPTNTARLSRILFLPAVPELHPLALALALLLFGGLLALASRPSRCALLLLGLLLAGACGGGGGDSDGVGLRFSGSETDLGRGGVFPDMAVTAEGNLHLCYRGNINRGEDGVYYQFFRSSSRAWSAPARLDDSSHSLSRSLEFGGPRIAAAPGGGATVAWAGFPDPGNTVWARDISADGAPAPAFQSAQSERSLAIEQHDIAIDAGGTAHLVFALVGQGQDGVYHKSRPAAGAWEGSRRRVFAGGRKHPVVEANPSASGPPRLWSAWRFRDLEYSSFDGNAWGEARRVAPPQGSSIGDPALSVRPDGQPLIGTSPFQPGAVNRSAYLHLAGGAEPLQQIDIITLSSSGIVDVASSPSGSSIFVWDRFVLGVKPDLGVISDVASLDLSKDTVVNKRRLCYKLSDQNGRFPGIPDADNSNALVLPIEADFASEQGYPAVEIRGSAVDLVYLVTRGAEPPRWHHRQAELP